MGKIMSIIVRQTRRVFVQERAERIISKPKPTMHPFYPTEDVIMKQIKADHPELTEKVRERSPNLEERVGHIRISSQELPRINGETPKAIDSGAEKDVRLLPASRLPQLESEFGFFEPSEGKVPRGRMLFSKAMELMRLREESRDNARDFARQFGITDKDTQTILEYFAPFTRKIDLIDDTKSDIYDESKREIVGQRAILQKYRPVSQLEQQRIAAKLINASTDKEPEVKDDSKK